VDVLLLAEGYKLVLGEHWVGLDLVGYRYDSSRVDYAFDMINREVGYTNCADLYHYVML